MMTNTLFKIQSIVAIGVFTFGVGALGANDDDVTTAAVVKLLTSGTDNSSKITDCNSAKAALGGAAYDRTKAQSQLSSRVFNSCVDGTDDLANTVNTLEANDDVDKNTQSNICDTVQTTCSILGGDSSTEYMKSAQESYNKAQEAFTQAQQSNTANTNKYSRSMDSSKNQKDQLEREYETLLKEIEDEYDKKVKDKDKELRDTVATLRKQITEKRNKLTEINDKVRQAEITVASAKSSWEASCRSESYAAYKEKKKEIEDKNKSDKTNKTKYKYSVTNLAGASTRKKDRQKRKMQETYVNTYKDCLGGITEKGASAKSEYETAVKSLQSTKDSASEQRGTLQKEIEDLMGDYAAAQQTNAEDKDTARREAKTKTKKANNQYKTKLKELESSYTYAMQDLNSSVQIGQQTVAAAYQNVQSASNTLTAAQVTQKCAGGTGSSGDVSLLSSAQKSAREANSACALNDPPRCDLKKWCDPNSKTAAVGPANSSQ